MGGKGGGGESPFTGDNMQNIDVLDRAINSVSSSAGPGAGLTWMIGRGSDNFNNFANGGANQSAPPEGAPQAADFGQTDTAEPAGPQGTGSQTNQQQAPQQQQQPSDTGGALAQSVTVPLAWQEAMKKKPQPSDGSVDIHGQV